MPSQKGKTSAAIRRLSGRQKDKFKTVMGEFSRGELKSNGEKVTKNAQAVAIALSEARKAQTKKQGSN
jgi:hypothetical protein